MAINVNFYTFSKKYNSTAQPTGDGTVLSCNIKAPSSIINPRLELATNPTAYNYCFIAAFSRYYFVSDITFSNGLWICTLTEDVLATYKSAIGSSSLYITRSATQANEYIRDDIFPSTTKMTVTDVDIGTTLYGWDDGVYIVNTVTDSANGIRSYQMDGSEFKTFYNKLFTHVNGLDWSDLEHALKNSVTNAEDYISSIYWFPDAFSGTNTSDVRLGPATLHCSAKIVDGPRHTVYTATVPKHPKASTYGKYLNAAPFSRYTLTFGPLAETVLDAALLVDTTTFSFVVWVDPGTGQASIRVPGATYTVGYGIPIPTAKTRSDAVGGLISAGAAVANLITGNFAGAVAGAVGAAESIAGSTSISSSVGSLSAHNNGRFLTGYFADVVDRDVTNLGRPLCTVTTPSALGGYMLVQNGSINAAGTAAELASIKGYLEGGFYYE